jgi:hypothetical protein
MYFLVALVGNKNDLLQQPLCSLVYYIFHLHDFPGFRHFQLINHSLNGSIRNGKIFVKVLS